MSEEQKQDKPGRKLTARQRLFIDAYLQCWNASEAAKKAGYSEKTAREIGRENLTKPDIKSEIDARLRENQMSADEALQLLAKMARGEVATKKVVSDKGDEETFDSLGAVDKIMRAHGKYKDSVDLTTGGDKIQPVTVIEVVKTYATDNPDKR